MAKIQNLLPLLEKQLEILKKMLDIERQKTHALALGDIEKLDDLLRCEQPLTMHNELLSRQAGTLMSGIRAEGKSLKQSLRDAGGEDRLILETLEQVERAAGSLRRIVRVNMGILHARMRVIRQVLAFYDEKEQAAIYNGDGNLRVPAESL